MFTVPFATTSFGVEDQDNKLSRAGLTAAKGVFAQDGDGQTAKIEDTNGVSWGTAVRFTLNRITC